MPREIVDTIQRDYRETVNVVDFVDEYYKPHNYSSKCAAVYVKTCEKQKEDYSLRVSHISDDFRSMRVSTLFVILLGVPFVCNADVLWLKKHDDELFCRARSGKEAEPNWSHCVHADFTRAAEFLFRATRTDREFEMQRVSQYLSSRS